MRAAAARRVDAARGFAVMVRLAALIVRAEDPHHVIFEIHPEDPRAVGRNWLLAPV